MTHSNVPRLRILQIVISPDPGGVLALAHSIGSGLTENGYDVETAFVVTHPSASYAAKAGGALNLAWQMITGRYHSLIAYQPSTSILVGVIGALLGNKLRIVHQTTIPNENSKIIRILDRFVGSTGAYRHNIVNTCHTRDQYCDYPESYRAKVVLIEHGVPAPQPRQNRSATLARYGVADDRLIVLNTARLVAEKNHEVLIRAIARMPGVRLIIAGDGVLRTDLGELVARLGLEDRVHLLGSLPHADTLELYGAADAFVFPSLHETFGISAVEAVIFGLPVIASDIPVLREVLQVDGKSAVVFAPPDDGASWEAALRGLVSSPPELSRLHNFANSLAAKYSEERMLQGYLTLLQGGHLQPAFTPNVQATA